MQFRINIKERTRMFFCIAFTVLVITGFSSCKKYLDKKPAQGLATPSTLNDLQAVLDNNASMNFGSPCYLELLADNYYVTPSTWNNIGVEYRKHYVWEDVLTDENRQWSICYMTIYYANFVLDNLSKIAINESDRSLRNRIEGSALFYRSFVFYQLAQVWCRPYSSSATTDLGIVLRQTSNVQAPSVRATVQQTYDTIIGNLKTAASLLPVTSLFSTRPNKAAAYAMLARVYLSIRDSSNAELYADAALALNSALLDYKTLTQVNNLALPDFRNNPEILFNEANHMNTGMMDDTKAIVDSALYRSYDTNDLRKTVFFKPGVGVYYWRGSYVPQLQTYWVFGGITTSEIYLIRAECRARRNNKDGAMADLSRLLRNRWKAGTFTDSTASDAAEALNKVLTERRKELLFRGLRWTDLRRFNLQGANDTLKRVIDGNTYTLLPNDPRWVLLIPETEISRSGIAQNPR